MTAATNTTSDWTLPDRRSLARICRHARMDPLHLCAVLAVESDFRFDACNPVSSATGIAQWMPDRETGLYPGGRTRAQVIALGVRGQLRHLAERYRRRAGKLRSLGHVYAVIAAPAAVDEGIAEDEPIYAEHDETRYGDRRVAWARNPMWHLLGGPVTIRSLALAARVEAKGPRFREMVRLVTGAEVPWLDLWSHEVRAEVAGLVTRADVIRYQEDRGLVADGEVGSSTVASLVLDYDPGCLGPRADTPDGRHDRGWSRLRGRSMELLAKLSRHGAATRPR